MQGFAVVVKAIDLLHQEGYIKRVRVITGWVQMQILMWWFLQRKRGISRRKKKFMFYSTNQSFVTTSDDPQQRKTVMDLVNNVCPERIYRGRLDRNFNRCASHQWWRW